jgi:hypothetical protein
MAEQQGWICPKCGRVYAPWVKECEACNPVKTAPVVEPWIPIVPFYPFPLWPPYPDYPGTAPMYPWPTPSTFAYPNMCGGGGSIQ